MLCQKCGLSEATVHRETPVYRLKIQEHLCQMCAGTGSALAQPSSVWQSQFTCFLDLVTYNREHFDNYGLCQIEGQISRLVAGKPSFASLMIGRPSGQALVHLMLHDEKIQVHLLIQHPGRNQKREKRIRDFFKNQNLIPERDQLFGVNAKGFGGIRSLIYVLSGDAHAISILCVRLLSEAYRVTGKAGLDFTIVGERKTE